MKRMYFKKGVFFLSFIFLLAASKENNAQDSHQLNLSLTLSGHIFVGIGYTYSFDRHWQAGATAFIAPEKGLPYAFNIGGGFLSNG